MTRQTYDIEIAGLKLELRLFEIKPGMRIAILTEGDRAQWMHIHALGQLPLFSGVGTQVDT